MIGLSCYEYMAVISWFAKTDLPQKHHFYFRLAEEHTTDMEYTRTRESVVKINWLRLPWGLLPFRYEARRSCFRRLCSKLEVWVGLSSGTSDLNHWILTLGITCDPKSLPDSPCTTLASRLGLTSNYRYTPHQSIQNYSRTTPDISSSQIILRINHRLSKITLDLESSNLA